MKKFEQPEMTATMFAVKDILTASGAAVHGEDLQGMPIDELIETADQ